MFSNTVHMAQGGLFTKIIHESIKFSISALAWSRTDIKTVGVAASSFVGPVQSLVQHLRSCIPNLHIYNMQQYVNC